MGNCLVRIKQDLKQYREQRTQGAASKPGVEMQTLGEHCQGSLAALTCAEMPPRGSLLETAYRKVLGLKASEVP